MLYLKLFVKKRTVDLVIKRGSTVFGWLVGNVTVLPPGGGNKGIGIIFLTGRGSLPIILLGWVRPALREQRVF